MYDCGRPVYGIAYPVPYPCASIALPEKKRPLSPWNWFHPALNQHCSPAVITLQHRPGYDNQQGERAVATALVLGVQQIVRLCPLPALADS